MGSDAVEAARAMGPTILAHREQTESERRIAAPIIDRLVDEGLCRMFLEGALGGHPATPVEALEAWEVLAGFEAAVPWLAWNNALVCGFSRFLQEPARKALFADPAWLYAQSTRPSGTARRVDGEVRISGRWSLVSGCQHAEWLLLHCVVHDGGAPRMRSATEPETRFAFVRRGDFEILDTWHVSGLRGTGSHDVVVEDVAIPEEQCLVPDPDAAPLDDPIARVPILVHMSAGFAAQALGVAGACVDHIVETARTKRIPGPGPDLRDRPLAQEGVAAHEAAIAAARVRLWECVGTLWDTVVGGSKPALTRIADTYAASVHADGVARDAVDAMFGLGGTSALYVESPLERAHRDIHAMMRHIVAQPMWLEDAGRVKFGLDPSYPLFAI